MNERERTWQHPPWLRIELAIRAVLADRLTRGQSSTIDQTLMVRVRERERSECAGWSTEPCPTTSNPTH